METIKMDDNSGIPGEIGHGEGGKLKTKELIDWIKKSGLYDPSRLKRRPKMPPGWGPKEPDKESIKDSQKKEKLKKD